MVVAIADLRGEHRSLVKRADSEGGDIAEVVASTTKGVVEICILVFGCTDYRTVYEDNLTIRQHMGSMLNMSCVEDEKSQTSYSYTLSTAHPYLFEKGDVPPPVV